MVSSSSTPLAPPVAEPATSSRSRETVSGHRCRALACIKSAMTTSLVYLSGPPLGENHRCRPCGPRPTMRASPVPDRSRSSLSIATPTRCRRVFVAEKRFRVGGVSTPANFHHTVQDLGGLFHRARCNRRRSNPNFFPDNPPSIAQPLRNPLQRKVPRQYRPSQSDINWLKPPGPGLVSFAPDRFRIA